MQIRYQTCDVFTDKRFGGNPLAVVLDGQGLSGAQMQRIAAEFNYSETTFILPPRNKAHIAAVRIFTPKAELAFAGHPNVGTAIVMAQLGLLGHAEEIVFEEKAGLVPISLERQNGKAARATLSAPVEISIGAERSAEAVARAATLAPEDIDTGCHKPVLASTGAEFCLAEVRNIETLARAKPGPADPALGTGLLIYSHAPTVRGIDIQMRMFAPAHGIPEDPATGSAATALAGLLASLAHEDGDYRWNMGQGIEMGRPSLLIAAAERKDGKVTRTSVGGAAVLMAAGVMQVAEDETVWKERDHGGED